MSFVTHPSQLAPPKRTKPKRIEEIPELCSADGTPAKLFGKKLRWADYREYQRSLRDEAGSVTLATWLNNEIKYLSKVICDKDGNLLWPDEDKAIEFLEPYDQPVVAALFAAALKCQATDPAAVDRAEKNSERIPSGSENGTSAPTSESLIPVS